MTLNIILFSAFAVACLAFMTGFLIVRAKKGPCALAVILKTIASIFFLSGGMVGAMLTGFSLVSLLIVLGLLFALIGDIVLDLKMAYVQDQKLYLNSGIASFSISNILYFVAIILIWNGMQSFALFSIGSVVLAIVFATVVMLLAKPLKLDFTGFKVQVFVYTTLVSLSAILGIGIGISHPGFLVFGFGALLVLVSDLVLSMMYFGGKEKSNLLCTLNHVLYYMGELLVVAYLFFMFA